MKINIGNNNKIENANIGNNNSSNNSEKNNIWKVIIKIFFEIIIPVISGYILFKLKWN